MIANPEIYRFISNLLSNSPQFVITAEKITQEIKEACVSLPDVYYVEFQTYVRENAENVHAHLFEPISILERSLREEKLSVTAKKAWKTRKLPEHYKSWEKKLAWVDENTRNIAEQLVINIKTEMKDVIEEPRGDDLCFFKGKQSTKSIFAALLLTKKYLKVRIRTDPVNFRDPKKLVKEKVYKGWFFKKGQEREFQISTQDEKTLSYAIELIKHSYGLAK